MSPFNPNVANYINLVTGNIEFKDLKKQNLRDNMSNMELVLNMLAEVTTKEISGTENPITFEESKDIAIEGGKTAEVAKDRIEKRIGKKVVNSKNNMDSKHAISKITKKPS